MPFMSNFTLSQNLKLFNVWNPFRVLLPPPHRLFKTVPLIFRKKVHPFKYII